jgi:hypothetical protein
MAKPTPIPDPHTKPFWDALAANLLVAQCCASCGQFQHPPRFVCRNCQSRALDFREVSGRGRLYSFTVSEQAFVEGFEDALPLVIGLVELEEPAEVRLLCNLPSAVADSLQVDMPMRVVFEQTDSRDILPRFVPA